MRGAVARPWSCPAVLPHLSHSPECLGYLRSATPISTASSGNPWAFTSLRRKDTMREHIWRRGSLLWEKRQWIEWQKENWEAAEVIGRTLYSPQRLLAFFQKAGQIVTEPLSGRLLVGDLTAAEVRQLSTSAASWVFLSTFSVSCRVAAWPSLATHAASPGPTMAHFRALA